MNHPTANTPLTTTTILVEEKTKRLDSWLATQHPELSRSRIAALTTQGHILLNNQKTKPAHPLNPGDTITLHIPAAQPLQTPAAEDIPLDIIYQDEHIIALNKPPGIVVHPGAGNHSGTLVSALLHHYRNQLSSIGGILRPGIVHRLDKDTSGILLIARTDTAHAALTRSFSTRNIEKHYLAICARPPRTRQGTWNGAIGRHPTERKKMTILKTGRPATTHYRLIASSPTAALLHCQILTGRTHQIRVHATHAQCPLHGDPLYGRQQSAAPRTMLHAACTRLDHPITGAPLDLRAPLPPDFLTHLAQHKIPVPTQDLTPPLIAYQTNG